VAANPFEDPRVAALYDVFDNDRSDLQPYLQLADELNAESVLDLGCGTGTLAIAFAERGLDVTAVDPAAAMLAVAQAKPGADRVRWAQGDGGSLPAVEVDLATMTGNAAQAIVERDAWHGTLRGVHGVLRRGGAFVFETRNPEARAWEQWTRAASYCTVDVEGRGTLESWDEVTETAGELVTFRSTILFPDGDALMTESTLRFRTRSEVVDDLVECGYAVSDVREAPDRPGRELVFIARREG
jgi:SAM-dependent methyltransferase